MALATLREERTTASLKDELPVLQLNKAVLAAIFGVAAVGTGGVASPHVFEVPTITSSVARIGSIRVSENEEDRLLDTQEKITGIRRYLSLNMTDLANVLRVGRPTVYSWVTTTVELHANHRERINAVYEIARLWRALSSDPMGRLVREPLENGKTMIELLSANKLDIAATRDGMRQIQVLHGRMLDRRLTVAEAAERAGVKLASRPRRNWHSTREI